MDLQFTAKCLEVGCRILYNVKCKSDLYYYIRMMNKFEIETGIVLKRHQKVKKIYRNPMNELDSKKLFSILLYLSESKSSEIKYYSLMCIDLYL